MPLLDGDSSHARYNVVRNEVVGVSSIDTLHRVARTDHLVANIFYDIPVNDDMSYRPVCVDRCTAAPSQPPLIVKS